MRSMGILAILVVAACTRPVVATPVASEVTASPTAAASAAVVPTASSSPTSEPLPSDLDPAIVHAIDMRRSFRLRSDLAFVLQVATDPRARVDVMDFPMYPEEAEQIGRDQAEQQRISRAVQAHAGMPSEFGGLYIDREDRPGVVVALFTKDVAAHEAAIREELGDTELFATRQVSHNLSELEQIQDRISKDMDAPWVLAIPAILDSVGVDVIDNVVLVRVSSAVPEAATIIAAHYDLGDRLRIVSDGTGRMLIPWGDIVGTVTLPDGKPYRVLPSELVTLAWDGPGDAVGTCGGGDVGFGVDERGRFGLPCQIGRRTVFVEVPAAEDDGWRSIGQGTVVVKEGTTVRLDIELTERP